METTLFVNGERIEAPDDTAIATAFESLGNENGSGKGLSLVILKRGENDVLTAAGHPDEGWCGLLRDRQGVTYGARIPRSNFLTQEKVVQIFQAFARGDESWEKQFQWDVLEGKFPASRILLAFVVLLLIVIALEMFLD